MSRVSEHRRADAGFTLIEVLVALAVVAVSLAAIGSLIGATVRGNRSIEQRLVLVEVARSIVADLPSRTQLGAGDGSGELAGNRWRINAVPYVADYVDPRKSIPWMPYLVTVRVQSPGGNVVRVDTVRLRAREESQ